MREREREPAKLLTEREIYQNQINRTLKPFKNGATKVAKGVGKAAVSAGKALVGGLQRLGDEGQKPRRSHKEAPIDFGFGRNKAQRKYQGELSKVSRRARIKRARAVMLRKRALKSRNY